MNAIKIDIETETRGHLFWIRPYISGIRAQLLDNSPGNHQVGDTVYVLIEVIPEGRWRRTFRVQDWFPSMTALEAAERLLLDGERSWMTIQATVEDPYWTSGV